MKGGGYLKKYAVVTVFIIAIAICISIYHLTIERSVEKEQYIPASFFRNNPLETFKQVFAENGRTSDLAELIARAVNGEARGESFIGQVAVGAVILNRVEDAKFPNTIAGVIYQPGAFTAVADGQINLPISHKTTVYKAASDALNGWDPSGGSIYYFNPATATSKWIWGRQQVTKIGKHIFAK